MTKPLFDQQYLDRVKEFGGLARAEEEQLRLCARGILPKPDMKLIPERDLAWAAGLIDGEGCITIAKDKPRGQGISPQYKALLIVTNTYKPVIERLRSMFGVGSIQEQKSPVPEKWKTTLTWVCCSDQAKGVIEAVKPYLFIKARDADILLEFFGVAKTWRCQDGIPQEILSERERLYCLIREGRTPHGKNGRKPKAHLPKESTLI